MLISLSRISFAKVRFSRKWISSLTESEITKHKNEVTSELKWPVSQLQISTIHNQHSFKYHPEIIRISVGFIDTHLNSSYTVKNDTRNVLLLCNEADLDNDETLKILQKNFVEPLHNNNCRVIIPFLPGSRHTYCEHKEKNSFQNQLLGERTGFILDFLTTANIRRLNVVVGHSFACMSAITLATSTPFISSLTLINPPPLHSTPNLIKPTRRSFTMVEFYERWYVRWLGVRMLQKVKSQVYAFHRCSINDDQCIHFIKTLHGIPYAKIQELLVSFTFNNTNLIAMSSKSHLFDNNLFNQTLQHLDVSENHHQDAYKSDLEEDSTTTTKTSLPSPLQPPPPIPTSLPSKPIRTSLTLPSKEHFIFEDIKTTTIVTDQILTLLNKTRKT